MNILDSVINCMMKDVKLLDHVLEDTSCMTDDEVEDFAHERRELLDGIHFLVTEVLTDEH